MIVINTSSIHRMNFKVLVTSLHVLENQENSFQNSSEKKNWRLY